MKLSAYTQKEVFLKAIDQLLLFASQDFEAYLMKTYIMRSQILGAQREGMVAIAYSFNIENLIFLFNVFLKL